MIRFYNAQTEIKVQVKHVGTVTRDQLYKYIHQNMNQLIFFASLEDTMVMINLNNQGEQFLTEKQCIQLKKRDILEVNLKSYEYMIQMEQIINKINDLKKKANMINEDVGNFVQTHQNTKTINPKFKINLLWSSPYTMQINNQTKTIKYQTKYDTIFHPIIQFLENLKKNIKLSAEQFNKANFASAVEQHSNVIYINTHSEFIYQTMNIFAENKDGGLEKFIFSQLEIEQNEIDLIILHSSYTEQFANELQKLTKNLILISSNVYSNDDSVACFNSHFFPNFITTGSIKGAFDYAMEEINRNNNMIKLRCCCFHKHSNSCKSKSIVEFKQADMFARYHKKCHKYNPCECQRSRPLIHKKQCEKFRVHIINEFIPTQIENNKVNYCCCPQLSQQQFHRTGRDIHSVNLKFQLRKCNGVNLEIPAGKYQSQSPSYLFLLPQLRLVNSRKDYLAKCIRYTCMKIKQQNKTFLLFNFFGSENTFELANYFYSILARKKIIEIKKDIIDEPWKVTKLEERIKSHSFIIIKQEILGLQDILERSLFNQKQLKIVVLISEKRLFLAREALSIQFKPKTEEEKRVGVKRTISEQIQPILTSFYSTISTMSNQQRSQQFFPQISEQMIILFKTYQDAEEKIKPGVIEALKGLPQLYQLFVLFAHFGKLTGTTINFLTAKVFENRNEQRNTSYDFFLKQIFKASTDSWYVMKPDYVKVLQLHERIREQYPTHTTIEQCCYKYLFNILLLQSLKFPRTNNKDPKQCCRLFQCTTLNQNSILSLYLSQHPQYNQENQSKPIISQKQILYFVKSLIDLKIKTTHHDFQLMLVLTLNSKLITTKQFGKILKILCDIEKIKGFEDPILCAIFVEIMIQIRFQKFQHDGLHDSKWIIQSKLSHCRILISTEFTNKIYKYIIDFDILMGYLMLYSRGWNLIVSMEEQNYLKQIFREYEKSKAAAISYQKSELFDRIYKVHQFKLNFVKMFVNNNRFQFIYKNIIQMPTRQTKQTFKGLSKYLQLLQIRNRIKSPETDLQTLWKWYQDLKWKYQIDNLKTIKAKLKEDLLLRISILTQNVCSILSSFPLKSKQNERMILVDYNLAERIRQLSMRVKQLPLNRINLNSVLTSCCRFLVLWFECQSVIVQGHQQIACEIQNPKQYFNLEDLIKEVENTKSDLQVPIETVIVCSPSRSFSQKLIKSISNLNPKPITNVVTFDFSQSIKPPQQSSYRNKLIMNMFTENLIKECKQFSEPPKESIFYEIARKVESGVMKEIGIDFHFVMLSFKARGSPDYEPIQINQTKHTLYKGQMDQVIQLFRFSTHNQRNQKFLRINLIGEPQSIHQFLNFFQIVCLKKPAMFQGGVFRIDCSQISKQQLPLIFIQSNLKQSLICLQNKKCLLILQNFDTITRFCNKTKTYEYLIQILTNDQFALSVVASSSKRLDDKFKDRSEKNYKNVEKKMEYRMEVIDKAIFEKKYIND